MMDMLPRTHAVAGISADTSGQDPTEPRSSKLAIAGLELLDGSWDADPIHRSELIDGCVYFTPARYAPRARAASELATCLHDALQAIGSAYHGMSRGSIAMLPHDLPLPDIVLTSQP